MQKTNPGTAAPAVHWDSFEFAGVCFTEVEADPRTREVRLPRPDITAILAKRFARRELEGIAAFCERSMIAKDSPMAIVAGVKQPFAAFLREQVQRVLAGGARWY
jgi:hypothetical protein